MLHDASWDGNDGVRMNQKMHNIQHFLSMLPYAHFQALDRTPGLGHHQRTASTMSQEHLTS